jgi:hypothetical protein
LPHQRNVALDYIFSTGLSDSCTFLSFIDDDISVSADYFKNLVHLFLTHNFDAIAGYDTALNETVVGRLLRLLMNRVNIMLKSGLAFSNRPLKIAQKTHWLPGGMQNYRLSVLKDLRFNGKKRMYGEDLEFSLLLRSQGIDLFASCLLAVEHRGAQTEKKTNYDVGFFSAANRLRLSLDFPMYVSYRKALSGNRLLAAWSLVRGVVHGNVGDIEFGRGISALLTKLEEDQGPGQLEDEVDSHGSLVPGKSSYRVLEITSFF